MSLGINGNPYALTPDEEQQLQTLTAAPEGQNPYALTPQEEQQLQAWENMSDDQKGEHIFQAKQDANIEDVTARNNLNAYINDVCVQRLAGGGATVGGAIRPDALITIGGFEMTVQQAVDAGVRPASMIGHQTGQD
jgi:uncharacterized lipoprotein YajG